MEKQNKKDRSLVSPLRTKLSKSGKWFLFDMGSHSVIVSVAYIQAILANSQSEKKGA